MYASNPFPNAHPVALLRAVVTALALFHCLPATLFLAAQSAKPSKQDTYTIRGTVVNNLTHAPVGRALVYSTDNQFAKMTDDQGRFEFTIPRPAAEENSPSQVVFYSRSGAIQSQTTTIGPSFLARKQGYFQNQGAPVTTEVGVSGSPEITISLVPEALIIGRVSLPANDGSDRVRVEIYRREVQEGRGHWRSAGVVSTRSNGEFRFANLQAGDYKLFTQELLDRDPLTFDPRGQLFGYPPVYYPASEDFENAAAIYLKAGETFSATLTPSRREYYSAKIGVLNASFPRGYRISVERQGHRGPGYSLGFDPSENAIVGTLPNGNYTVEVTQYGENGASGITNFSVNGGPAQGSGVVLVPNPSIEVRLNDLSTNDSPADDSRPNSRFASNPKLQNPLSRMNLALVQRDELSPMNWMNLQNPKNQEDETLAFANVPPGSYWLHSGCNQTEYISEINSGGRDLLHQPLDVGFGSSIPPIEITIKNDGAKVEGTIENWPREDSPFRVRNSGFARHVAAQVLLLPLAENSSQSHHVCQAGVTPTGEFTLSQVPPGEYLALAFDHPPEEFEYQNPEVVKKYEAKGQILRLESGPPEHLRLALNSGSE